MRAEEGHWSSACMCWPKSGAVNRTEGEAVSLRRRWPNTPAPFTPALLNSELSVATWARAASVPKTGATPSQ